MRQSIRKVISMILTAAIMLPGAGAVRAAETRTEYDENADPFIRSYEEDDDLLSAAGSGDVSKINKPRTSEGVSTWDCIWFGNYWQEDTNGDGKCYAEETPVEGTTYPADEKQPIKWRVLDIDKETGEALLLSDKLIDIVQYNETETGVTWETCTMRSYLNGYDGSKNVCNKDFSGDKSFIYNAFSEAERDSIIISDLKNPDNPVYGTGGGNATQDKIFCLSLDEARKADYGFVKNEFTYGEPKPFFTDNDPTRVAVTTKFTEDKPDYYGNTAGESAWWWLRSPGDISYGVSGVSIYGAACAYSGLRVDNNYDCARPAFRMNLSSSSSLWSYAGTVDSRGDEYGKEVTPVSGVSLPPEKVIKTGGSLSLKAMFTPENATDKSISWKSSDPGTVSVDENGVIMGIKEGTATITVKTNVGGYSDTCKVTAINYTDPGIKNPVTEGDTDSSDNYKTTWDCIWFGEYWQEDTNDDGHCFDKETRVIKREPDDSHSLEYYTDQYGNELYYFDGKDFEGTEKTYPADAKQPIKWRVLDIDEHGNAFLLADKLIDPVQYNERVTDVTWETCTLRSYLNCYGPDKNKELKDFASGFLNKAFSYDEKEHITVSYVVNADNNAWGIAGGNNTEDKLFCLSLDEAMNKDVDGGKNYGFVKNDYALPDDKEKKYATYDDETRIAVITQYTADKPGYNIYYSEKSNEWWLRSPGIDRENAANVSSYGRVYANLCDVGNTYICVRPAFRMNLSSSSSLWDYAGTVDSKGGGNEIAPPVHVTGVELPPQKTVRPGRSITLSPVIKPDNADNKSVTWSSSAPEVASVDENGVVTGIKEGTARITVRTADRGKTDTCEVKVINIVDLGIRNPVTEGDTSTYDGYKTTWDCIWFGEYWQEDTNRDGHCFKNDTTVSKKTDGKYYDQDDNLLINFTGREKTYPADSKQPIKWRVLDIDENGNALLLSDRLLEILNDNDTDEFEGWNRCAMRSFLNCYGGEANLYSKDFSDSGFLKNAFSPEEAAAIEVSLVKNPNNPVFGTEGWTDTKDKLFCLSLDEARNLDAGKDYGFVKKEFVYPSYEETHYYTNSDPTRAAKKTRFTIDKPGFNGNKESATDHDWWWLRSPGLGYLSIKMSYVSSNGTVYAGHDLSSHDDGCVRPAFRMNLADASALWCYAGWVCSDGTEKEKPLVKELTLPLRVKVREGGSATLHPVTVPSGGDLRGLAWESSEPSVASVDENGKVAGIKSGIATITAKIAYKGLSASCVVRVIGADELGIDDPLTDTDKGISNWDCIWFGDYWQEDTNEDGYCFSRDITVSSNGTDYYDQDGKLLDGFKGEAGKTYFADIKQPVKWRVLDIDENGNALMLSDRLLDIIEFNNELKDVPWEACTLRQFLNCFDDVGNPTIINPEREGFINDAFSLAEKEAIAVSPVRNKINGEPQYYPNPVYKASKGGNDTIDRIFCLSLSEALNSEYGFISNSFELPRHEYVNPKYMTEEDHTRLAVNTAFVLGKSLYGYVPDSFDEETPDSWWLRSPGGDDADDKYRAAFIENNGSANAFGTILNFEGGLCVRPAFRMNLADASALWSYAGCVDSRGDEFSDEKKMVTGVTLSSQVLIRSGNSVQLTAEIEPEDAFNRDMTWKTSDNSTVTVSGDGLVTGLKDGSAYITVTTKDRLRTASCNVLVKTPVKTYYNMIPGEIQRLRLNTEGRYTYGARWTLSFNNAESKGCVSLKNGIVTAKNLKKNAKDGKAKATVTAEYCGVTTVFNITVNGNLPLFNEDPDNKLKAPKTVKAEVPATAKTKPVTVSVTIPKGFRSSEYTVTGTVKALNESGKTFSESEGARICTVGAAQYTNPDRTKASKATFEITPVDAGAAYIVWTVRKNGSQKKLTEAVTKVLVKKPTTRLSLSQNADPGTGPDDESRYTMTLTVGEGRRLIVTGTNGNTDPRDLSFKVKGKGLKVSKSGYVVATTPGIQGTTITVKSGKITDSIRINVSPDHSDAFIKLNKTSASVKAPKPPKPGAKSMPKPKTVTLKPKMSVKGNDLPELTWNITDEYHQGITVDEKGMVSVDSTAKPGCYEVKASPETGESTYNTVFCELIVK